jgi:two-component system, response regulator PdtaR
MRTAPLHRRSRGRVRVLLVEDETFVRMDVAWTLREAGFQVIEAASADAALQFVEIGEEIDLVFTDIQTPGVLDGLALAERVRARFPMMPVIITSGNETLEGVASRLGRFVRKPYEPSWITRIIVEAVESTL